MMRHKLSAASIAVIAQLVAAGTAQAQSWDAAANFTPASPPTNWAYVQRTGAGCVAPGIALSPTYAPVPGVQGYIAGQNTIVAKNTTNAAIAFSSVTIDGGALLMHPGTRGECAVLRFKAPGPGTYQVAIKMTAIDRASPNDVRGYIFASSAPGSAVGGAELLSAAGQFGASKSFSRSVTVTGSNPYVDFALDDGGNNDPLGPFRFDSTSISMVVTGRPDTDGGNGGGIPVLSCSKSAANPATVDVSTGKPGWTLKLPNGAASAIVQTPSMVPSPWTAVPGAQWVGPQGAPTASGNYVYETRVRVLKCPNGEPARITAQFRADNRGTLSVIDPGGTPITTMNQAGTPNYGFLPASLSPSGAPGVHSWSAPVNGIYTIRLTVANSGGPTGVAANVVLTR